MKIALTMIPMWTSRRECEIQEFFPLAIYLLASYIRKENIDVDILAYKSFHEIDISNLAQYDLIGFSCNTFNYAESCEIAELTKNKNNNVKILFGGIHVTHRPMEAIKNYYVDFVIKGEGEQPLIELIKSINDIEKLKNVPSLYYKIHGKICINAESKAEKFDNSSLLPSYDLIENDELDYLQFETSRGCRNRCTFCSVDKNYDWRGFSSGEVIDRLDRSINMINGKTNIKTIIMTDDCFTTDTDRAIRILQSIKVKYPNISLRIEARIKDLLNSEQLLHELSRSNLSVIQIGVECGYNKGLGLIRKAVKVEEVEKCAYVLNKWGLGKKTYYSYIVGLPWEGKDECLQTIKFANQIFDKYSIPGNIVIWQPLPSELAIKHGLAKEEWYLKKGWWTDTNIFLKAHPKLSKEDINEITFAMGAFTQKSYKYLEIPFN